MGHGKETPRQKMIGMMYLVLTALLALNTSKDVLNAFVVVDEGLTKTIENFADKNELIYNEFEKAAAQNEKKAGKWRDQANEVKKRSGELYEYIQDLKLEIVNLAEKGNIKAVEGRKLIGKEVQSKDNTDIPAQIMVGSENNGKANDLRKAIENYKEYLLSLVNEKDESVKAAIERSLDTQDPPVHEGKIEKWQNEHFEHLPLIGVTTIMSGLQANVRNAESDIIKYLYTRIDAGSFKFNKLEATVIHNSNYVLVGNEYVAKVFMAAFDTTQKPEVLVGTYDSTKTEDGSYKYEMRGSYQTLDVVNGMGVYKVKGSKSGNIKWGGLIKLKAPEGGVDIMKPFKSEYQVAEASLVVSPTKMNVFYIAVDNPVEISVPGVPADKIFPSITNGNIRKDGKGYVVTPSRPGQVAQINVMAEIDKVKRSMGMKEFRVKTVPDPVAKVGGLKGGSIDKAIMQVQTGVVAEMENFDFDIQFKVTEFNLSTTQSGFVIEKFSKSNKFTTEQMDIIKRAGKNQKIYIESIKAVGPDGTPRPLSTISLSLK